MTLLFRVTGTALKVYIISLDTFPGNQTHDYDGATGCMSFRYVHIYEVSNNHWTNTDWPHRFWILSSETHCKNLKKTNTKIIITQVNAFAFTISLTP